MGKNEEFKNENIKSKLYEKKSNKYNDNNNKDPYGYDFVPTVAHCTNIDEQRKEVNYLENVTKPQKSSNNDKNSN